MRQQLTAFPLFILFILCTIYISLPGAPLPAGVSIHRLDNGMEVLLIRNPGLPMTGANMVVKVGSAYETFATSGMSHMLEHLLFNGTTTRTQKELYDETDRIGGYNNANTSEYYTNYMMVTPAEHFEKGLSLQADMLFRSTLPVKKFEKEKGIVLEEISKSLAEPREQLERNLISVLYGGHALSLPTLGTYSTIKSMKRDDVYAFFKNNYVPNNMILSVVGDFKTAEMLEMIRRIYGNMEASNVARPDHREWITGFGGDRSGHLPAGTFHRSYSGKETLLHNIFHIPEPLSPAHVKLVELFLQTESKKILKILDSEFPGALKNVKLLLRATPFRNYIEVKSTLNRGGDVEKISARIRKIMASIQITAGDNLVKQEMLKAKTDYLKNIEKPHMFGIYNAYNLAVYGIESVLARYSGQDLPAAASELEQIRPHEHSVTLIQSPAGEDNGEIREVETRLYRDPEKGKSLIVTDNGGSELIAIHYLVKHKASLESEYGKDIARVLHRCFGNRLNSEAVTKKTSPFGITSKVNDNPFFPMDDIYLHPDFGYIRIEGVASDVPALISILNDEMSAFTPTKEEFNTAYSEISRMSSPMMMGNMAKKLFDRVYQTEVMEDRKYKTGPEEITYDNLLGFTARYFSPDNMIVAVSSPEKTGDVDQLFAGFFKKKEGEKPAPWEPGFRMRDKPRRIEKKGMGKRSYLFWGFAKKTDPDDLPALRALSLYLSDKIIFDIREKRGMAYRMSAGIKFRNDRALFYINMGTRPENTDRIVPDCPGFFMRNAADKLTDRQLERLVNMYLGRMKFRRLSSINRAYYLSHSLYFNGDIRSHSRFFEKLKKVKAAEVRAAAKKYLGPENPLTIIIR